MTNPFDPFVSLKIFLKMSTAAYSGSPKTDHPKTDNPKTDTNPEIYAV